MRPRAYYNEFDPFAAAWLRNLMADGLIMEGDVDERSITDVQPADLRGYVRCHFFAGIGGWDLALRLAGWPEDRGAWTGSCPCQPLSSAGKRKGHADERHLWPAFYRLIAECRPATVFGEQVASRDGREWLAGVRADLEDARYAVGAADLCAPGVGAPHIRQRLYWGASRMADAERGAAERHRHALAGAPRRVQGEAREQWLRPDARDGRDAGRMADRDGRGQPRLEDGGLQRQRVHDADGRGEPGRMADAASERRHGRQDTAGPDGRRGAQDRGRLDDSLGAGLEGHAGHGDDGSQPGRLDADPAGSTAAAGDAGFWSRSVLIPCADGKARRVPATEEGDPEPALFPLAHGIRHRGRALRGAGNAIVPQVAAQFVTAFAEVAA